MIKFILKVSIDLDSVDTRAAKLTRGELGVAREPPLLTTERNSSQISTNTVLKQNHQKYYIILYKYL